MLFVCSTGIALFLWFTCIFFGVLVLGLLEFVAIGELCCLIACFGFDFVNVASNPGYLLVFVGWFVWYL